MKHGTMVQKHFTELTQSQLGVYLQCIGREGTPCYNIPCLYVLEKKTNTNGRVLDGERFCRAVETAIMAHPTLFTRLSLNDEGIPMQHIEMEDLKLHIEPLKSDRNVPDIGQPGNHERYTLFARYLKPFRLLEDRLFHVHILEDDTRYYLLWDAHHIINDGTSMDILLNDIKAAYEADVPSTCQLPEETMTLAEMAELEKTLRTSEAREEGRRWYAETFDCDDLSSGLSPDRDQTKGEEGKVTYALMPGDNGADAIERTLDIDLDSVNSFCQENGVYKSTLMITAYAYLLARYNNEQTSLTRTVFNGRTDKRLNRTQGMFVKTIPVYCKFDDDTTILDLLRRQQEQITGCRSHEAYSYMDLMSDLHLESNNTFAWHGELFSDMQFLGSSMQFFLLKFDKEEDSLYFKTYIRGGRIWARVEFEGEYSKALVEEFIESYENVVNGMLTQKLLRDISLTNERQLTILDQFNETDMPLDETETVVGVFRQMVARQPDKVAVVFKDRQYTYREVDEMSDRLAAYLASKGLMTGHVVSILVPRSEWMLIASLGVLKAGCAYQPLDPTYPKERLEFMMQDADARLLISFTSDTTSVVEELGTSLVSERNIPVLDLKDFDSLPKSAVPFITGEGPRAEDLFVLLYTSGSTGVPKGVMLEHRNVMAFCRMHQKVNRLDGESRVGAYASFGFDACLQELWAPLTIGATIYVIPEDMRLDLIALNSYFEQNCITHGFMTTQVARQFVNDIENHSLKVFVTGGEKLSDIVPPPYILLNGYGPTESICYVTAYEVREQLQNIPIGKAVPNMHLFVMDRYGHRQPIGAAGELWVSGPQVSRGYLNQPEKTAEAFVEWANRRCYRTGDIVRYLTDGNIEYVGRRDGQVKIRGFRIELKEVETIIRQYPSIKDVTVQAFDQAGGGKYIAAYIVSDEQIDVQALHAFIKDVKPPYMVPAVTMQIESIPLTQNQKVDKRALPIPTRTEKNSTDCGEPAAPLNVLEEELKQIVAKIIGFDGFGITTPLCDAGLTSIMAIQLAVELDKRYGVALNSRQLTTSGTLQSIENEILTEKLKSVEVLAENTSATVVEGGEEKSTRESVSFPLSYAQMGVYFDCQKNILTTLYNIPTLVSFAADTDVTALRRAVESVIKIHPQFFVHFDNEGGAIVQVVDQDQPVMVEQDEMSEEKMEQYKHDFVQPFNLQRGPLYRMKIVKTPRRVCLLTDVHHLIFDGSSFDLFLRQVCSVLDGATIEKERLAYSDFVKEQQHAERGEQLAAARDFFHTRLATCEGATEVQSDLTNPSHEKGTTAKVTMPFNLSDIETFCHSQHLTPAHLTLAAVMYTVGRFTNNEQVCMTTISGGRSDVRTAGTVGMFVNTLALTATIGEQTVREYLNEVSHDFNETLHYEQYPFARINADYGITPEIMFAYEVGVVGGYVCQGHRLVTETLELNVPKFKVAFYITEEGVTIEYDSGRYSHELMRHMAQSVCNAIAAFISHPEGKLKKVSLLDAQQIELLDSFNQTEVPYDDTQTVVSLFRQQAALHPDNMAVVYHDRHYTYREVDEMSDRIACYIHSILDVQCESSPVVSILIPRCEWMAIASLGVLKAGCAYQPLDPTYPKERLAFMMRDADARLLICCTSENSSSDDGVEVGLVSERNIPVLDLKDFDSLPKLAGSFKAGEGPRAEDLFILLYTSGSTGVPKGVMLEHRNLVAFCHWYQRYYGLDENCRVAAYASYGFDASMMDIYPALTCGSSVYIIGDDIRLNLPALNDYFNAEGITHSFITTQVGYQFATHVDNHSLRHFSVGGEKLSALQPPTHYRMHNGYGPTECTIFTTTYPLAAYEQDIPIGKPVDNMKLFIVDKDFNRLPPGAAGELWISGPQVGRGYLNQPEKTAEAFMENSSSLSVSSSCKRFYRTGDIVRYLADGNIQFVGRRDSQVKIRGFRIELKEVEAVIRQFPGISDATVQAFDSPTGGKFIAAYVVSDQQVDVKRLNDFIGKQKPPYMIPAATMQIESIPLNQNQKVNRKLLPKPVIQSANDHYEAPANEQEEALCDIFARVLELERVGATDDFFNDLGGTSLNVTLVIVEADKLGLHIAYGDVFSNPTPRLLAAFLNRDSVEGESSSDLDAQYDYTPIKNLLRGNTLECFRQGERRPVGRVLLTGATGYLGIHVLWKLVNLDKVPEIYCLIRAENNEKAEGRLKRLLFYYYGKNFKELFGSRLHVVLGDVTSFDDSTVVQRNHGDSRSDMVKLADCQIDTVFNCAAVVKHFSAGTEIEDVNIGGTENCIRFCQAVGARLIHVSTYSTAGLSVNGKPAPDIVQTEQRLYYGQYMDNRYVHSKFVSERVVLEAVALHGLDAKVMRVGNLAPRSTDGEFQINAQTNSSMGRVRVFKILGCYPYEMTDQPMEFSPINEVASAIVLLAETPRGCCLFHPFNNHSVHFGDVLQELRLIGEAPRQVETAVYEQAMERMKSNPVKAQKLQSLIAYQDLAHGQKATAIRTVNDYTSQVLYRLGFRWSTTSWDYVDQFLTAIDGLGFFDE